MARVTADGDDRVVVGHPSIQFGGEVQPAVAGYPLPKEPPPQPSATVQRGRPEQRRSSPRMTFTAAFMAVILLELITHLFLATILQTHPSPITSNTIDPDTHHTRVS
ncbi:hypothetical protein E2562_035393 [Oryza meyeriana var. granulata]|uniref:Uncharacterized protein n=1 Tax=Oryza meyeriana var. granulata TaxID=110450 RepID=A0A6G1E764_9ORYZ|nr:hypothetical protein E2562_035393 [Oryza meyeriana var. granulata]